MMEAAVGGGIPCIPDQLAAIFRAAQSHASADGLALQIKSLRQTLEAPAAHIRWIASRLLPFVSGTSRRTKNTASRLVVP